MFNVLIIGFGSIGLRHYNNFKKCNADVSILSRRLNVGADYSNLECAIADKNWDVIFVCNETSEHVNTLMSLKKLDFKGLIVVEKPLFDLNDIEYSQFQMMDIRVAYNFRFHPLLTELKKRIQTENVISGLAYVGQFLPTWRPSQDYRKSYSAAAEKGGGVLLDLSHEIDFLFWLLGPVKGLFSKSGRWSQLEIDSIDSCHIILEHEKCSAMSVNMNYLDHIKQRFLILNCDQNTFKIDFIRKEFFVNENIFQLNQDEDSYMLMTRNILNSKGDGLTSLNEAICVTQIMKTAEESNLKKKWILL